MKMMLQSMQRLGLTAVIRCHFPDRTTGFQETKNEHGNHTYTIRIYCWWEQLILTEISSGGNIVSSNFTGKEYRCVVK